MPHDAAIFIDGGYLQKVLENEFGYAKLDFAKLVREMHGDDFLIRAYYYNCMPLQGESAEERLRYDNARRFYAALNKIPHFEVRFGRLVERNGELTQKRVDILFAIDLVLLALKKRISTAYILTGDSDFVPAIQVAKNEGVVVHLFHGKKRSVHDDILQAVDDRTEIGGSFIEKVRFVGR